MVHKLVSGRVVIKLPCVLHFGGIWLLPYNLFSKILLRMPFSVQTIVIYFWLNLDEP